MAGAVSVVSPLLLDFVETRFPETSIAMVLTLSVVSVGVLVLSTVGEKLVGSSRKIRKWILGNEFIEDDWTRRCQSTQPKAPTTRSYPSMAPAIAARSMGKPVNGMSRTWNSSSLSAKCSKAR